MHEKCSGKISDHRFVKDEVIGKKSYYVCGSDSALAQESSASVDLAIVPGKSTTTLHSRQVADMKPGWPLLHRQCTQRSTFRQISVVQWAMQLPSRNLSYAAHHNQKTSNGDHFLGLDSKSGAIVPVDAEIGAASSPERGSGRSIPKELEGLHEKYSSTCRLFEYQELISATSNFLPGMYFLSLPVLTI